MEFHFKFQKLLDIEKFREEELIKHLKILQKQLLDEEKFLAFLQSLLSIQQSEMEKKLSTQAEVKVFILYESYFSKLNRDIAAQGCKVKETFQRVGQAREKLLNAFKRRKVLEKLRERHEREYKEHLLRMENKHLDEIATSRFYYKRKNRTI